MSNARAGEFDLIRGIRRRTHTDASVVVGIGDDTAVVRYRASKDILITTDMLIEDRHFRRSDASAFEIGRKALAVNLSDIAAMGGVPTHAVVAVGLPERLPRGYAEEISRGIRVLASEFGVNVVGGDTNSSEKLVVSVTLLGECPRSGAVRRSGAMPGDVLFVSGSLGGSYASKKHLNFTPRVKEARWLADNFALHAMMDLSDGLAGDVRRIAEESGVGVLISEEALPLSPGASVEAALGEGEDFELLFAVPPREAARLTLAATPFGPLFFTPVGKVTAKKEGLRLARPDGKTGPMPAGFDHFKAKKGARRAI